MLIEFIVASLSQPSLYKEHRQYTRRLSDIMLVESIVTSHFLVLTRHRF
jgi:hypothetical protein